MTKAEAGAWRWPTDCEPTPALTCPGCRTTTLQARFSCLSTALSCSRCQQSFELAELHRMLDDTELDLLATLVADRLSDRV